MVNKLKVRTTFFMIRAAELNVTFTYLFQMIVCYHYRILFNIFKVRLSISVVLYGLYQLYQSYNYNVNIYILNYLKKLGIKYIIVML